MDDDQTLRSMVRDDAYHVERVLSDTPSGRTELVTLDGEGPMVRKRIPLELANMGAWATVMDLSEPLLPHVEEIYRMPDELVVVYDYVPGESLRQLVERQGVVSEEHAVALMCDVCRAASVLHQNGLVHRDITPGNVIVYQGRAHLIDLGIARLGAAEGKRDTHVLGTWGFAAPEQYGFAQTDARADIYAIGRLLGYALTGILPADDGYASALANEQLVAPDMAALIGRATAFEPSARFQSAEELAEALEDLEASHAQGMPVATWSASDAANEHAAPNASAPSDAEPYAPRRSLAEVPIHTLVLGVVGWLACLLWSMILALVFVGSLRGHVDGWSLPQQLMAPVALGGTFVAAYVIYQALMHRGPYAYRKVSAGRLLLKMVIIFVITCMFMLFIGLIVEV